MGAQNFLQSWNKIAKDAGKHVDDKQTLPQDEVDKLTNLILTAKTTRLEVRLVLVAQSKRPSAQKKVKFTKYMNEFLSSEGVAAKIAPGLARLMAATK